MTLPSFLIVGAMKAGSTSLFRWLESHPDVRMPKEKEPNFFCDDERYRRGVAWYHDLFPSLGSGEQTGEASVAYADPHHAVKASLRAHQLLPNARILFLQRDPEVRLRSHFRHEVKRGREKRPLAEALRDAGCAYVRASCYRMGLSPWRSLFDQVQVVDFDALFGSDDAEWRRVLAFLGLSEVRRPSDERHNVTEGKDGYRPLMRWAYDRGWTRVERAVPRWIKRTVRPALLGTSDHQRTLLTSASGAIPSGVRRLLAEQTLD